MDNEQLYIFLHKQIRNFIPGKEQQRFLIEKLRGFFFPVELEEKFVTLKTIIASENLTVENLCHESSVQHSVLHGTQESFLEKIHLPERKCHPVQAFTVENGYCFRNFILDAEMCFIRDATTEGLWSNLYRRNKSIRALKKRRENVPVIAFNTTYTDNYYHWFADLIGRFLLLPHSVNAVVASDIRYPYQRETLQLLGIPMSRVIPMTDYSFPHCARLTFLGQNSLPHPEVLKALRRFARNCVGEEKTFRRLYISRGDTRNRRGISNEEELLPILKEFGFERALFSGMSIKQQMRLVRQASDIVFPQGAAVINMAFSKAGTRFLELYSPLMPDKTGVSISSALGLEHHVLEGTAPEGEVRRDSLYSIEPRLFRQALERLTQ